MAKWRIDRIKAKHGGLFTVWRYVDVFIDENGIITTERVPGEYRITENLKNYAKVSRTGVNGRILTEYCNYDTFTNYRIYPMNSSPYVNVEDDLNAEKCGYETVLPEPSVPYNPFDKPTYGLYSTYSFCDIYRRQVDIELEKKNYTGGVNIITDGGGDPVIVNYKEKEDVTGIFPAELSFQVIQHENFEMEQFYTEDERMFRATVKFDGEIYFRGYIIPDSCNEDFKSPHNVISLKLTDGITQLKNITYPLPVGVRSDYRQSFKDVIGFCLNSLDLDLDIVTICNVYASTNPMNLDDDPLALNTITPLVLADNKGTIYTCDKVLEMLCTAFKARLYQSNGTWRFERVDEPNFGGTRERRYNYKGQFLLAEVKENVRMIGGVLHGNN